MTRERPAADPVAEAEHRATAALLLHWPANGGWIFYRLSDRSLRCEGVSTERAASFWVEGRA